jgi:hypothetical protein
MANYNKSFNFRNGVQVDDDNFIVNANGLVGIGTSIPREFLDVHGTAKVTGLVTATNLAISGVSEFYSDVNVGSGITFNPSTGAVRATTFFGSAVGLTDIYAIAVDGWYINAGNISTTSKVGIGTTLPYYSLQVGQDPLTGNGFSVDALSGNVKTTGILTAPSFVGNLTGNVTGNVDSTGISTFSTLKVGTGVTISGGIVTATSFVGNLTGTATTTTNIPNLTGAITSNNTTTSLGSFTSAQLSAALSDETGSGANVFATSPTLVTPALGNATATSIVVGSGVTINSGGITASAGIITAFSFVGELTGNVVGIASTARDLTSDARVSITHIASQTSSIGISTVSTRLYAESIGVGTNSPSGDIHIRKSLTSRLQVTSDTAEAIIAIGRSTTLTGSNGALIFGNTSGIYPYSTTKTLDIINYDTGNINQYLHYGSAGVGTGNFNWIYAPNSNNPLMTLTYGGNLGIGITNPTVKLQVSGMASVSSLVTQDITATGSIVATGAGTSISARTLYVYGGKSQIFNSDGSEIFPPGGDNLNLTTGISTFFDISVNNRIGIGNSQPSAEIHIGNPLVDDVRDTLIITRNGIGIGTDDLSNFNVNFYNLDGSSLFGSVGIGTTNIANDDTDLYVSGNSEFYGGVGIGTTNPTTPFGSVGLHIFNSSLNIQSASPTLFLQESDNSNNYYNLLVNNGVFGIRYNNNFPAPLQVNSSSVLIGTATSTGTALQSLQVSGGAYVSGNLGIGITNPKGVLDLVSTTQPLYLPRMTTAQRNLIVGISSGAVIFNTSVNEFQGYTGTSWVTF